jgi:hypothetical protein
MTRLIPGTGGGYFLMIEESPEEKLGLLNEAENEVIRKNRPFRIFALFLGI